ncbi:methyl-accepting chemotaxis protein [Pararobbsia silviterrae]|uniref:HAMP domain-containing protein n=1 Tax=Pararobbsia silviterrae TaxID=1792498 RepID=A0A494XYT2_9BURK|nr:methyl-accepting chemotaxis protein [Pararobbsia silviterrae]RKP53284.1 HAMP domain-containing protein [Pararobbsia silviterrae]
MNAENLKIGTRLGLGFGLVMILMVVLIAAGLSSFTRIGAMNEQLIDSDWVKAQAANSINLTMRSNARRTLELIVTTDQNQRDEIFRDIARNKALIDDSVQTLEKLIYLPEGVALLNQFKQDRVQYVASFTEVGQMTKDGKQDEARQLVLAETLPRLDVASKSLQSLVDLQGKLVQEKGSQTKAAIASARDLMIAVGALAILLGAGFAVWITRSITRPINEAVKIAQTISKGDLTSRIEARTTDEVGQLLHALNAMNNHLGGMVSQIRTGAETISSASGQIAAGNIDLSSRTEEQAASLEETAASMEELAATVKQNSDNANQANRLTANASDIAQRGGLAVSEVVTTMNDISDSSSRISEIVSMIDGIAFQTNILALNAAVESARAGAQGRGFAVVAGEVRTLAQRSAQAAKEIKQLIEESVGKVEIGAQQAERAGATMEEVVRSVRHVTTIMSEISTATQEQANGIDQINLAVSQMDEVTQQNAALVEEAAAAASSLQSQAGELVRSVASFKLPA